MGFCPERSVGLDSVAPPLLEAESPQLLDILNGHEEWFASEQREIAVLMKKRGLDCVKGIVLIECVTD
jgi:hypothetical protein